MRTLLIVLLLLSGASSAAPSSEKRVYAGVYLNDVSGFDLKEGRFEADLDVWLKWEGGEAPPAVSFLNGEIESKEEVQREADGDWRSIRWRVQGTFRGTFPLQSFPFDSQTLRVQLALPEREGTLIPDLASSGMSSQFSITGWLYEPYFAAREGSRVVASDFGSIAAEGLPLAESEVEFTVQLFRPFSAYLLKFLLPLGVILLMGALSFIIPPDRLDVRASIAVTALLSVVAFHFSQSDSLPEVSYLVIADKLFLAAYGIVFVILLATVLASNLHQEWPRLVRWMDRGNFVLLPIASVVSALVLISSAETEPSAPPPELAVAPAPPLPSPGGDELRIGLAQINSLNSGGLSTLLYRGLGHRDGAGVLVPHLAERLPSMTNPDVRLLPDGGMTVRWRLRPGLRWSDGAALTSADILFTLSLLENPSRSGAAAIDERTVVVTYSDRKPAHLDGFRLYPKHALETVALDGGLGALTELQREAAVPGDGPYRLARFTPGEEVLFERNPYFAGAASRLARLRFVPTGAGKGAEAYLEGKVELLSNLGVESMSKLREAQDTVTSSEPGDLLVFLQPDLSVKPLDDPRVRRAILLAIDRERIGRLLYGEQARVANGYLPPESPEATATLPVVRRDVEAASALLEVAGVKRPLGLRLRHVQVPKEAAYSQVIDFLVEDLAAIGIQLEAHPGSSKEMLADFLAGAHGGLLLYSRSASDSPARFFNLPYDRAAQSYDTSTPRPHFAPDLVATHDRLVKTLFVERKQVLSRRLQERWAQELPVVPITFSTSQSARVASLRGYSPGLAESLYWNVETWFLAEPRAPTDGAKVVEGGSASP